MGSGVREKAGTREDNWAGLDQTTASGMNRSQMRYRICQTRLSHLLLCMKAGDGDRMGSAKLQHPPETGGRLGQTRRQNLIAKAKRGVELNQARSEQLQAHIRSKAK